MKVFKKVLGWLISPFSLGLFMTGALLYISFLYYDRYQDSAYDGESVFFDLLREIHQKTVDFRLLDRGPTTGHPDIAIIGIDEPSVEQEGRWPWPREKIARIVEKAIEAGAKVIAFDIIFSEEDANSQALTHVKRILGQQNVNPELQTSLVSQMEQSDSDRAFGETIRKHADKLVLGAYFEESDKRDLEIVSPHLDACIDVLHERSADARYWNRDQRRPAVTDDDAKAVALPRPLKDHLLQYFSILEATAMDFWAVGNPQKQNAILDGFDRLGLTRDFPIPALLYGYLNDDRQLMKDNIEAATGQAPPDDLIDKVIVLFGSALSHKDKAIIRRQIRAKTVGYCYRFLLDDQKHDERNDELLSESAFNKLYSQGNLAGQFALLSWNGAWEAAKQEKAQFPFATFGDFLASLRVQPLRNQVTSIDRWWLNIPVLEQTTKYSAFFNALLDSDGTLRRNMFLARRGNDYATSLALGAFVIARNLSVAARILPMPSDETRKGIPLEYKMTESDGKSEVLAGFRLQNAEGNTIMSIPVDSAGRMTINYSGKKYTFPHISAADLINDDSTKATVLWRHKDPTTGETLLEKVVDKKEFLKDKILFFGATATGIFDLRVTPFEENFPGVETHANMLSNLLVEHARSTGQGESVKGLPGFLRSYPEREAQLMLVTMLGVGIVLSALLSYFGSIAGLFITLLFASSVYAVDKFVLFNSGIVVTVMFPMTLVILLFVELTFYKYFTEERTKRELKGTFEKYVSPAIVAEVLADPENIELGGKKMELTVMFSDVRGFTTISEKLDPRALSDLLNSYLTPMTNLVFQHKGTLDKYMGDAIMAFWGAPIHFPDHAKHACRCALKMIDKLKELQAEYRAKGLPEIDIGIGLNTGEMSVGNMGSDTVRSYTVMGDAVNLGSRLEGINKQYGTRIIISEFTQNSVKDSFVCREVDWVRVKGKAQPVRIFELVAEGKTPDETTKLLQLFQQGFDAYHAREWNKAIELFTAALNLKPDDEPSSLYLERCHEYLKSPPPDDWDGVFTMTTK